MLCGFVNKLLGGGTLRMYPLDLWSLQTNGTSWVYVQIGGHSAKLEKHQLFTKALRVVSWSPIQN